jgi:hypothetical protein
MKAAMPWLRESDEPLMRQWAEHEIIAGQAFAAAMANGVLGEKDGEPYLKCVVYDWR